VTGFSLAGRGFPLRFPDRRTTGKQLAAILLLSWFVGAVAGLTDSLVAIGVFMACALAVLGFVRPALFFALFLLVRPMLDDYQGVARGLAVLVIMVAGVALVATRERVWPRAAGPLAAVVFVSGVVGVVALEDFGRPIQSEVVAEFARLLTYLGVYLLAAKFFGTVDRFRKVVVLVALSAVIPAISGVEQLIAGVHVDDKGDPGRITGTFVGPNAFGAYCALAALILMFLPGNILPRLIRWGSVAVLLVALYGTYSRVGWVLILLGVAILGWRRRPQLVVAMALGSVVLALAVPSVAQRALPVGSGSAGSSDPSSDTGYESYDWRIQNWNGLLKIWEKSPIFGKGLQTTTWVNVRHPTATQGPGGGYDAHNMAVRMLVEGGVVLFVAYILFLGTIVRTLYRLARQRWELSWAARLLLVLWSLIIFAGLTTTDPLSLGTMMFALLSMTGALEGAHRSWAATASDHVPSDEPAAPALARRAAAAPAPSS
jgi:putative inorganic carbon (HCO3(-)) transporter